MVWLVPRFKKVFEQIDQALPGPTKFLMTCSDWLSSYKGLILLAMFILTGVMINRAVKTEKGRQWWHRFILRAPLVRGVVASGIYANFARTLGTLLSNGVPVLQALKIVERTVSNVVISREIGNARERVTDGTTISGPLAAGKVFPRIMTDMMAVGEQTGDMPGALEHVARRYENELERQLRILTSAIEPILIVLIAAIVGFIAISILMAVLDLTTGLSA
jgi:type II secretory pathway component PulF